MDWTFEEEADDVWAAVMSVVTEHYTITQLEPSERFVQLEVGISAVGAEHHLNCGHLKFENLVQQFEGDPAALAEWSAVLSIWVRDAQSGSSLRLNTLYKTARGNSFRGTEAGEITMENANGIVSQRITCRATGTLERALVDRLKAELRLEGA